MSALAHAMHHRQHTRAEEHDDEAYAGAEVTCMEGLGAGSVTSFVRKLFQMVQDESDSVVGFVEDGTAFEVKDPRRLEQDILPKYFRHSRFQSLVRQLNFYSFKKISKERSVWIYKHAYFRRDEPELLHALKRKTNQHGAHGRIGSLIAGGVDGEGMTSERPRAASSSSYPAVHHHQIASNPSATYSSHPDVRHHSNPRPAQQHLFPPSLHKTSSINKTHKHPPNSSRSSAGGGPSTGGVGGAAAPCYGSRGGPGSPHAPGFAWAGGAGGRPVTSSGGGASIGNRGPEYRESQNGNTGGPVNHGPPSSSKHYNHHRTVGSRGSSLSLRPISTSPHAYRQGPAMGDATVEDKVGSFGRQGGGAKQRGAASLALTGANVCGSSSESQKTQAIWGLSALCQVASASSESHGVEGESRDAGYVKRLSGGSKARSPPRVDDGHRQQKRPCRVSDMALSERPGWGYGGGRNENNDFSQEDDQEVEEDGVTTGEHDDASMSSHRRSASHSSLSSTSSVRSGSPEQSPVRGASGYHNSTGNSASTYSGQVQYPSGSSGVFCQTWDWGKAAQEPAIKLPGSFVNRRYEEVDPDEGAEMEDEDEGYRSNKSEGEQYSGDERCKWRATRNCYGKGDQRKKQDEASYPEETCPPQTRDPKADMEAEIAVGLEGIGALFTQFSVNDVSNISAASGPSSPSDSIFLAMVTNSRDGGLREVAVFCAGPAGEAPETSSPKTLARQVSSFLQTEDAIAQDLKVYAEALDPAAIDVVIHPTNLPQQRQGPSAPPSATRRNLDGVKLLRIFCRYAACRLGRALEVASFAARQSRQQHGAVAQRVSPRLDECRWKWWRAAARFS